MSTRYCLRGGPISQKARNWQYAPSSNNFIKNEDYNNSHNQTLRNTLVTSRTLSIRYLSDCSCGSHFFPTLVAVACSDKTPPHPTNITLEQRSHFKVSGHTRLLYLIITIFESRYLHQEVVEYVPHHGKRIISNQHLIGGILQLEN